MNDKEIRSWIIDWKTDAAKYSRRAGEVRFRFKMISAMSCTLAIVGAAEGIALEYGVLRWIIWLIAAALFTLACSAWITALKFSNEWLKLREDCLRHATKLEEQLEDR